MFNLTVTGNNCAIQIWPRYFTRFLYLSSPPEIFSYILSVAVELTTKMMERKNILKSTFMLNEGPVVVTVTDDTLGIEQIHGQFIGGMFLVPGNNININNSFVDENKQEQNSC